VTPPPSDGGATRVARDERRHVSIGDVLDRLRDEFPDVTVSKIRFLESQGLIDPERTPSGYRKFYDDDIERLRWVLRQQKDNFLPLKVIKERLDEMELDGADAPEPGDGAPPIDRAARAHDIVDLEVSGVSLTREELARSADLTDDELAELETYGLVSPSVTGRDRVLFDEDALTAARAAAGFLREGVEPRHLRMYRAFADRESALFEQLLLPYRRRRNPEATAEAAERMRNLVGLGRQLRTALLRQSLRRSSRT
jgi:DNA-binding transcriptional MerR regulator